MLAMRPRRALGVIALLGLLAPSLPAAANSLLIWPIYPVIESRQQAGALWLENRGNDTVTMQLRVFSWHQEGGENHYRPQQALVGSPPMMEIAPGERQLVRLIRQAPPAAGQEQAYRVIVDEIPALAAEATAGDAPRAAVRLQMRYSLPLFVYGEGAAPPERLAGNGASYPGLSWRVVQQGGQPWLEIRNAGNRHARLNQVAFVQGDQRAEVAQGLLGYVLPGAARRWPLPQGLRPAGELRAQIQGADHSIAPE